MRREFAIKASRAEATLGIVGEYVWWSRTDEDAMLRMGFGAPRLRVRFTFDLGGVVLIREAEDHEGFDKLWTIFRDGSDLSGYAITARGGLTNASF